MQLFSNQPAHGRFARTHEANEGEVDEMTIFAHGYDVADSQSQRTLQIDNCVNDFELLDNFSFLNRFVL